MGIYLIPFFSPNGSGPPRISLCTCVIINIRTCRFEKGKIVCTLYVKSFSWNCIMSLNSLPPNHTHYTHCKLKDLTFILVYFNINLWFFNCERKWTFDSKKIIDLSVDNFHNSLICTFFLPIYLYVKWRADKIPYMIAMLTWRTGSSQWWLDSRQTCFCFSSEIYTVI